MTDDMILSIVPVPSTLSLKSKTPIQAPVDVQSKAKVKCGSQGVYDQWRVYGQSRLRPLQLKANRKSKPPPSTMVENGNQGKSEMGLTAYIN